MKENNNPFSFDSTNSVLVADYILCNRCLFDRGLYDMTFKVIMKFKDGKIQLTVLDWMIAESRVMVSTLLVKKCQVIAKPDNKTVASITNHFSSVAASLGEFVLGFDSNQTKPTETEDW